MVIASELQTAPTYTWSFRANVRGVSDGMSTLLAW
jgi:hypothetical protein